MKQLPVAKNASWKEFPTLRLLVQTIYGLRLPYRAPVSFRSESLRPVVDLFSDPHQLAKGAVRFDTVPRTERHPVIDGFRSRWTPGWLRFDGQSRNRHERTFGFIPSFRGIV